MTIPSKQDLLRLRDLTQMTGVLEQTQVAQLKMWPKVILCANKGEVEFNPDEHFVVVDLSGLDYQAMAIDGTDIIEAFKKRMSMFDNAIKFLLGDEYSVVVKVKGSILGSYPPKTISIGAHQPKED